MSRWKAAAIHVSLSLVIALLVIAALYLVWYPPPLFQASGLDQFLIILLGVDVVVGPLLTLVVFRAGKPGMRMDMSVIALAQVAALLYGLHVMWQARPVYMVAAVDRLTLVTPVDFDPEHLALAKDTDYASLPLFGAQLVGAKPPSDPVAREQLMHEATEGGKDYDLRPQYYVPYAEVSAGLVARARPVSALLALYPSAGEALAAAAVRANLASDDLVYVPLKTARRYVTAVLAPADGRIVLMLDVDPWAVAAPGDASVTQ